MQVPQTSKISVYSYSLFLKRHLLIYMSERSSVRKLLNLDKNIVRGHHKGRPQKFDRFLTLCLHILAFYRHELTVASHLAGPLTPFGADVLYTRPLNQFITCFMKTQLKLQVGPASHSGSQQGLLVVLYSFPTLIRIIPYLLFVMKIKHFKP